MKTITIILFVLFVMGACTRKLVSGKYIGIEPWKDWEIELKFNKDSTFTMVDRFGCNRFNYSGQWHHYDRDSLLSYIILHDTTKVEYLEQYDAYQFYDKAMQRQRLVSKSDYFPVISNDTIHVLGKKLLTLRFRNLPFHKKRLLSTNNLGKVRTKMIINHEINEEGKELFIKAVGNGKGIKEIRKTLNQCYIGGIPLRLQKSSDRDTSQTAP